MKFFKAYLALIVFAITAICNITVAQDFSKPFVISPAIGDTVDRHEQNRYGLFPAIPGFQSATYAMGADSILYAKILAKIGEKADTLIFNCGFVQDYLETYPLPKLSNPAWANSVYFSSGYGVPMGVKYELGVNGFGHLAISLISRFNDNWEKPGDGQLAIGLRTFGPFIRSHIAPYLSFEGSLLKLFSNMGGTNYYTSYSIGAAVTANRWLQVNSELGIAHTARYLSGGPGFFGDNDPIINEVQDQFLFNIGLEIDFNGIF